MAKYIVINGSTRKGNSYAIANFIKEKIDGDVEIFNIKDKEIGFCQADNACKAKDECIVQDDAYDLINDLEECDGAFIITPIFFGRLPGMVDALIDRFYSKFNPAKEMKEPDESKKIGIVFSYGGGEADYTPVAEHVAFEFGVLRFGAHKNVMCSENNDPKGFESKDDQQSQINELISWVCE